MLLSKEILLFELMGLKGQAQESFFDRGTVSYIRERGRS
jgi:hypothetical protein